MIQIEEQIYNFLPNSKGKLCVVPDIKFSVEPELEGKFVFFVVRQIDNQGKPTGLYLRDVSSFRTEEQNANSKYKFQSLFKSILEDPNLVRLKPNEELDLPEYAKNYVEYASFDDFICRRCEIVPVFEEEYVPSGSITDDSIILPEDEKVVIYNPKDFPAVFNGKTIYPKIINNFFLHYTEVTEEIQRLRNSVPESDWTTVYYLKILNEYGEKIFLNDDDIEKFIVGCLPIRNYKTDMYIKINKGTIEDPNQIEHEFGDYIFRVGYSFDPKIFVLDDDKMFSICDALINNVSEPFGTVAQGDTTQKDEKIYKVGDAIYLSMPFSSYSYYRKGKIHLNSFSAKKIYLDPEFKYPVTNKLNLGGRLSNLDYYEGILKKPYLFVKKVDLTGSFEVQAKFEQMTNIRNSYDYYLSFNATNNFTISNEKLKQDLLLNKNINDVSNAVLEIYDYKGLINRDYDIFDILKIDQKKRKIKINFPYQCKFYEKDLVFNFNDKLEYIADFTDIMNEKKSKNIVPEKTSAVSSPVQYSKNPEKIYLKAFGYGGFHSYFPSSKVIETEKERIYDYNKGLDIYLVDRNKIILSKYHFNCEIKAVFCGTDFIYRGYDSNTDERRLNYSWYATNLDLTDLKSKYNIIDGFSTFDVLDENKNKIGQRVVLTENYGGNAMTINMPNYRFRYDANGSDKYYRYHIPETIIKQDGLPLIFSNIADMERFHLYITVEPK